MKERERERCKGREVERDAKASYDAGVFFFFFSSVTAEEGSKGEMQEQGARHTSFFPLFCTKILLYEASCVCVCVCVRVL